ncbi:MAG: SGNH/GDSL hydrolase family protein [Niabella sp.]
MLIVLVGQLCHAQDKADLEKIAASQGGSTPLLFAVPDDKEQPVAPGSFYDEKECLVRSGIPNFFGKVHKRKDMTVAFIGGSITQSRDGYRMQVARYMQARFPGIHFRWVNAGVSGTGTDLGAFRIREQILQYQPDLIFIEFAVNGAYQPGMEGMIRQIIKTDPHIDICLIYTIMNGQTEIYQRGEIPQHIQGLEDIASHYNLPSIHVGMEAVELEARDKLVWKGSSEQAKDRILFSTDGIHPGKDGGNLYASAIARALEKCSRLTTRLAHTLSDPLITDAWDAAGMYKPQQIATFDAGWKLQATEQSKLEPFKGWFDTVLTADKPGASLTFFFEGDQFGIFDIGGPEVGQLSVWVDDSLLKLNRVVDKGYRLWEAGGLNADATLNRFNQFCNNRYRGQYDVVQLQPGKHKVILKVSQEKADKKKILGKIRWGDITANPEKYDHTVIYLGRILLRGRPIGKN